MKKVLVVSSIPFSYSNRGIDLLTLAFVKKGYSVDHLVFPNQFNTKNNNVKEKNQNINQLYSRKTKIPYLEKAMWYFPRYLTKTLVEYNIKNINIDFNNYDIIVLESGKPIFLIDKIPKKVKLIYRQSDSVKLILSKNRYLWSLEKRVMERADLIYVVRECFYDVLPEIIKVKTKVIVNGFNILRNNNNNINLYKKNAKNVVYLGYTPLDKKTIEFVVRDNPNVNINIIGKCLNKRDVNKLSKYSNFIYYGIMNSKEYLPYIQNADLAIIPYKNYRALRYIGLNSKYLLFCYYNLPVVSYKIGQVQEFNNIPINFVDNKYDFSKAIKNNIDKKIKYNINFSYYSQSGRINEYLESLKEFMF